MTTYRISRKWFLCVVTGLVIASFGIALAPQSPAQAKKDTKKAKDKADDSEAKKDAKVEPPPTKFPARIDTIDGAQGGIVQHVTLIDDHVTKGWKDNKTFPSERCTDFEFIRRASLDIIGRIPTVEEIGAFMKQAPEKRRSWVVNAMLDGKEYGYGAEYAQHFANIWTTLLMTRSGSGKHYQVQMNDWLYGQFKGEKGASKSDTETAPDWAKTAAALISGKGSTNGGNAEVNFLLHNLGDEIKQDTSKNGKWDMIPATSRTTKLFLGLRTQCVQCHDHPFNDVWRQDHFWGVNAFLRQIDTNGKPMMMMVKKKKGVVGNQEYDLKDNPAFNITKMVGYERRNTVYLFTDPTYPVVNGGAVESKKIPKNWTGSRREALAKFVTEDPQFARAYVNRMWGHFFGKSFTKDAVDDFGDHNAPSHPELLEKLSEDWAKKYAHNPKMLIRWICNSQAYGLSSRANKWNDKQDDEPFFTRMLLKPMTPEQMFESLMIATANKKLMQNKEVKLAAREKWLDKLVVNFGNDEGGEGSFSGTVIQALMLMNGQEINDAINDTKEGAVAEVVCKRGASMQSLPFAVNDLFMHTVGRPATQKEINDIRSMDYYRFPRVKGAVLNAQFWTNYYQDIMWALLNSNEFILNH